MTMSKFELSRRHVLRGLGSIAIGLPLLEAMGCNRENDGPAREGIGRVQSGLSTTKRFVALLHNNGRIAADWFPTGSENDFTLGPAMSPLAPHKQDMIVFKGIDCSVAAKGPTNGHYEGATAFLSGRPIPGNDSFNYPNPGITIDQHIMKALGVKTKIRNLAIGSEPNTFSVDEFKQDVPAQTSPVQLYNKIFADAKLSEAQLQAQLARRKSILDSVMGDYTALKGKVSAADTARLDAHLTQIRDLETRLSLSASCGNPGPLSGFPEGDNNANLPRRMKSLIDLAVIAMSCDITRSVTLTIRHGGGGLSYFPWLGLPSSSGDPLANEHHEMSHEPWKYRTQLLTIAQWFMSQTAYFAQKLKDTPDGLGGSLFDSVLMLQGSENAEADYHNFVDMPYFLLGSAGGYFKTGRYLTYPHVSHNDMLVSILQAFGLPDTTFGDPASCTGPLAKLVT
jgi:hypothetical protein